METEERTLPELMETEVKTLPELMETKVRTLLAEEKIKSARMTRTELRKIHKY